MKTDNWQASHYAKHGRFVSELHQYLLSDLAPKSGEHILDLGCGDGEIAEVLSDLGCAVIGIDSSANLITRAKSRGVNAVLGDAQSLTFVNRFDAVLSNAAMHWMPNQDAVCSGVYRALRPGGRFVGEMGGNGNISKIQTALAQALTEFGYDFCEINPWTFPIADEHTKRLEAAGFHVQNLS